MRFRKGQGDPAVHLSGVDLSQLTPAVDLILDFWPSPEPRVRPDLETSGGQVIQGRAVPSCVFGRQMADVLAANLDSDRVAIVPVVRFANQ